MSLFEIAVYDYTKIKDEISYIEMRLLVIQTLLKSDQEHDELQIRLEKLKRVKTLIENYLESQKEQGTQLKSRILYLSVIKKKSTYETAAALDCSDRYVRKIRSNFIKEIQTM